MGSGHEASVAAARGLSSRGTWACLLCGMRDLPRSGIEPVSPALAGEFFTTEPPGKPWTFSMILKCEIFLTSPATQKLVLTCGP